MFISISKGSFLAYKKVIDLCILTLYPTILLYLLLVPEASEGVAFCSL